MTIAAVLQAAETSDWKPAILSALLALALYAVTLGGTYVYDDRYILLTDPRVGDVAQWGQYWTKDYFNGGADNLYRPLVSMSYAIQAKLHGRGDDRAWAFHLVNWLLHAGACAAVAELARRMTQSSAVALIAGLLFAAHPIHVEAVANVIGRAELMCGLGMFAALVLFMRPLTLRRAIAIWSCFVIALLSKEQGMLLPLLLVLAIPVRQLVGATPASPSLPNPRDAAVAPAKLDYASPNTRPIPRFNGPTLLLILTIAWTLAAYLFLRENTLRLKFWWDRSFLDETINPMIYTAGADKWLLPLALLGRYLALLIAPVHLLADYGGEVIGSRARWTDPYLWIGIFAAIAWIIACVIAARRRNWIVVFCLIACALLYGMVANFLTLIGTNFAERLMYIPSAFACILAALALSRLPKKVMIAVTTIVLLLFAARTVTYARQWNHPVALFETGIARQPQSIRLYLLLAEEYQRRGEIDRAREALARGRDISPNYYRVWLNSARLELDAGDYAAARRYAERGQRLKPTLVGIQLFRLIEDAAKAATQPATTRAVPP